MNVHFDKIVRERRHSLESHELEYFSDRRHLRHCLIFDPVSRAGARRHSHAILFRAKIMVTHYLFHLYNLMQKNQAHLFKEAWFCATNASM